MDHVKDAKPLLKKMEKNRIGLKRSAFYMAYALYYEKHKRFEDAENMYRLGTQK
uniref:BUB1 N-terminal domain-containing protein n=1 Tax=Oryza glaberrima TaxID=4538 RepID=I1QXA3_ORYGL